MKLAERLHREQIAHADLQHGNVLLVPKGDQGQLLLKLVDYDGMWTPSLAMSPSGEWGHANYQHPQRKVEKIYDVTVDRYSHLVICCALRCLCAAGRRLWERFDNGDNLLFTEADFRKPADSALFRHLWSLPDPNAHSIIGHLVLATQSKLRDVPHLHDLVDDNGRVAKLTPQQEDSVTATLSGQDQSQQPNRSSTYEKRQADPNLVVEDIESDEFGDEITLLDWDDDVDDEIQDDDDEACHRATFVHEHSTTGFLADLVMTEEQSRESDSIHVAFDHQLLKPKPCRVKIQLPSSSDPVQYVRLANLIHGYPVVLRIHWLNRLPDWSTFGNSFGLTNVRSVRIRTNIDGVFSEDSGGIVTKGEFKSIIPADVRLPHIQMKRFRTVRNNQKALSLTPAICRSDGTIRHFPQFKLFVPPAPAGIAWMQFTFRIDPDGRYTINARDPLQNMRVRDMMVVQ